MITAIELYKLRNGEYVQFTSDVLKIVELNNPTSLQVNEKFDAMSALKTELEALFKKSTENPITAEIENLDKRRDNAVSGILGMINSYGFHYDGAVSGQAKVVQDYLKLYTDNIAQENYNAETATINNIVNDFENKPELLAALTELHLIEWKEELKEANTKFNDRYIARTQELATATPDTLKSKRLVANTAYYELRDRIDAFAVINPSALYTKTINEIDALITQYNTLLAGRAPVTPPPAN
jgi:hypothetical protein